MLIDALKRGARLLFSGGSRQADQVNAYPLDEEEKLHNAHSGAPLDRHLDILFRDMRVGDTDFATLYRRCLNDTATPVTAAGLFRRFQGRASLLQYFLRSFEVDGARAEVGVYRGATSLLLARAARAQRGQFSGKDFFLIDSFSGTSESDKKDLIPVRDADGTTRLQPFFPARRSDTSPELVRGYFREFPEAQVRAGWIPDVFATLPDTRWSFVHLDVTLHAPTLAGLEYFYPRLAPGGVIVCDGYGSPFCPGLAQAWDEFCAAHELPYVVLGSRQSVILRT